MKKVKRNLAVVLSVALGFGFAGCDLISGGTDVDVTLKDQEYVATMQEVIVDEIKNAVTEIKAVFQEERLAEKFSNEINGLAGKIERLLSDQSAMEILSTKECTKQTIGVIEKASDELKDLIAINALDEKLSDEAYAKQTAEEIRLMTEQIGLLIDLSESEMKKQSESVTERIIQEIGKRTEELALLVTTKIEAAEKLVKEYAELTLGKIKEFSDEMKSLADEKEVNEILRDQKYSEETIGKVQEITDELKNLMNANYNLEKIENQAYAVQIMEGIAGFTDDVKSFISAFENVYLESELMEKLQNEARALETLGAIASLSDDVAAFADGMKAMISANAEKESKERKKYHNQLISSIENAASEINGNIAELKNFSVEIYNFIEKVSDKTVSQIKQFVDDLEAKNRLDIQNGTAQTAKELENYYDKLQLLLRQIESAEKLNAQTNTSQITEKINDVSMNIILLLNQMKADEQKEIKDSFDKTISEIRNEAASIKQLIEKDDFENKLSDRNYAQQTIAEIQKVIDSMKGLIDKADLQEQLRDEKYSNELTKEVQSVSKELQDLIRQMQEKQDGTMHSLTEQAVDEIRQMIEKLKIEIVEDLSNLISLKRSAGDEITPKEWTSIVYMAADNNLEAAAIQDFNELEASSLNTADMNVLVLLDRAEGYDGTNSNWTDTRLFQVKQDSGGKNGTIVSKRIDCPELDIYHDRETELDMGSWYTLNGLINFAKRKYIANHYALIVWGHGTGWRGTAINGIGIGDTKAVAIDQNTSSYMSVAEFGKAVNGKGLDLIAFDTCFGAVIENFYELKDAATCLVGAAGVVASEGFDYSKIINDFSGSAKNIDALAACIAGSTTEAISVVRADGIKAIADGINSLAKAIASTITTRETRDSASKLLLNDVKSYGENYYPSDLFLDIYDIAKKYSSSTVVNSNVKTLANNLIKTMENNISTKNSTTPRLGIFFISLLSRTCPASSHSEYYVNGKLTNGKSAFVNEMTGWVPTQSRNTSLLDKLFYTVF